MSPCRHILQIPMKNFLSEDVIYYDLHVIINIQLILNPHRRIERIRVDTNDIEISRWLWSGDESGTSILISSNIDIGNVPGAMILHLSDIHSYVLSEIG